MKDAHTSFNGLPTCRHCAEDFHKWHSLKRHVERKACPALAAMEEYAKANAHKVVLPHIKRPDMCTAIWKRGWESLLANCALTPRRDVPCVTSGCRPSVFANIYGHFMMSLNSMSLQSLNK